MNDEESLRGLPAVHELLDEIREQRPESLPSFAKKACRQVLDEERKRIRSGKSPRNRKALDEAVLARLADIELHSMERVINATGVVLHTAIGRACFPPPAFEAVSRTAVGYCVLQWNRETGRRGHRDEHIEDLLVELTGAEAATVVNNNAGATLLILSALCRGREVVVSRGQLVEIGGAFRIPEVMKQSGAVMREVGCTNRTHLRDYEEAVCEETAALLRVHPSNYRIRGFTGEVSLEDLVGLGNRAGLPVIDDLGAGSLVDLEHFGLPTEPTVSHSIEVGASLTTSSGDKLIGGPQAGIITGKKELVDKIKRHPLARALRVGKLTLSGLQATLRLFLEDPEYLKEHHPVYNMLGADSDELEERRKILLSDLELPPDCEAQPIETDSYVGSGSLPDTAIPSLGVGITAPDVDELARLLRLGAPAVASRVEEGMLKLDVRTVFAEQIPELARLVSKAAGGLWG